MPLLVALRDKLGLPSIRALLLPRGGLGALAASLRSYLSAATLILARTVAKVSAYTVVGREAARLGAVASAAHILCFQLGVVTTQVCESAAIATQATAPHPLTFTLHPLTPHLHPSPSPFTSQPSALSLHPSPPTAHTSPRVSDRTTHYTCTHRP